MAARVHAVAGTLLLALALPAAAQAVPVIEPLKPCYVAVTTSEGPKTEGIDIRAAGFTPDSKVDLTIDGAPVKGGADLQIDDAGALTLVDGWSVPAPFVGRGIQDFTVALTEQGNPANTVSATAKVAPLRVRIRPTSARPSQRIRFKGSGFTADRPVYAHYVRKGKQVERVRMVRRTRACGRWSVRRRQFPMRNPDQGRWVVQFDQSKKYRDGRKGKLKSVRVKFRISLVPR